MHTEILLYTLVQWRMAGARRVKVIVQNRQAGRLLYDLCGFGYDFVIEFQFAPGIKVFVIEISRGGLE